MGGLAVIPGLARTLTVLVLLGAMPARAQQIPVSSLASLRPEIVAGALTTQVGLVVRGADGPACWLAVTVGAVFPTSSARWMSLGLYPLDATGGATINFVVPTEMLSGLPPVHFRAVFRQVGALVQAPTLSTTLTSQPSADEDPQGELLDFGWGLGGVALPAGERVSLSQPWGAIVTISADNFASGHPDEAILFDSAQPTGGDPDLATPGPGLDNNKALGKLLIVAEDIEGGSDGVVDDPDDEQHGGVLVFDFPGPVNIGSFSVVDVDLDEPGGEVRYFKDGVFQWANPLNPKGDNSVQAVGGWRDVTRMEIELAGSAGVGALTVYPCDTLFNFDENSMGTPLGVEPGHEISGDFSLFGGLGVWMSATNNDPTHPDKCIIFDSAAPTGDDPDLLTPGAGIGNLVAQRQILVIAQGDSDSEPDGLIDDPNAENAGGMIVMDWFTSDGFFRGATVLDVDRDETASIVVYLNALGDPTVTIPLTSLGDNSSQTLDVMVGPTRRVEFHFSGSAGLAELRICPAFN